MEKMKCFDESIRLPDIQPDVAKDDTKDDVFWTKEQKDFIFTAVSEVGPDFIKCCEPKMSLPRLNINYEAFKLGKEYVDQLNKYDLTDLQAEAALYAYKHDFNMIEQLVWGELPQNVKLITDAVNTPGFIIMEYFDETGAFLDYEKIANFLSHN